MTSGFELQEPLTNNAFIRPAPCPRHVGVKLPREETAPATPQRPPERNAFSPHSLQPAR
jgi:hypothetical protein